MHHLIQTEKFEQKVKVINSYLGIVYDTFEIKERLTAATRERIKVGMMCQCGACLCCATTKEWLDSGRAIW